MKKILSILSLCLIVVAMAVPAMAVPLLDLTSATTAITGELTPAIASGMPIFGMLLAVGVGIKFYKRFVH